MTRANTLGRPASTNRSPSASTVSPVADSGRTTASSVAGRDGPPLAVGEGQHPQPAVASTRPRSGVSATGSAPSASEPAGRCRSATVASPGRTIRGRPLDGPGDVAVGRVEQGPPDDQAPHVGHGPSPRSHEAYVASGSGPGAPPRISAGSVVHRQHPAHGPGPAGTFSQVVGRRRAEAGGHGDGPQQLVVVVEQLGRAVLGRGGTAAARP